MYTESEHLILNFCVLKFVIQCKKSIDKIKNFFTCYEKRLSITKLRETYVFSLATVTFNNFGCATEKSSSPTRKKKSEEKQIIVE